MVKTHKAAPARTCANGKPLVRKINTLWPSRGRIRPGSAKEAELVNQYLPLVKSVVGRLAMTLPPHVDGEDLYSAGLGGLLGSIRQFDPTARPPFGTYSPQPVRGRTFREVPRLASRPRVLV